MCEDYLVEQNVERVFCKNSRASDSIDVKGTRHNDNLGDVYFRVGLQNTSSRMLIQLCIQYV